jgi:hypothetical protein
MNPSGPVIGPSQCSNTSAEAQHVGPAVAVLTAPNKNPHGHPLERRQQGLPANVGGPASAAQPVVAHLTAAGCCALMLTVDVLAAAKGTGVADAGTLAAAATAAGAQVASFCTRKHAFPLGQALVMHRASVGQSASDPQLMAVLQSALACTYTR